MTKSAEPSTPSGSSETQQRRRQITSYKNTTTSPATDSRLRVMGSSHAQSRLKRVSIYHISETQAHDGFVETPVCQDTDPAGAAGPRRQGHRGGSRCVGDRHGDTSKVTAMGRADLTDRHPDQCRAIAEGEPRLYVRDRGRGDIWRRHRGTDSAFRGDPTAGIAGSGGRAAG